VHNLRYALRAAELAQPYAEDDLAGLLENWLTEARAHDRRTGAQVFREMVLPTRYSPRQIAAACALCEANGLPLPRYDWDIELVREGRLLLDGLSLPHGSARLRDRVIGREHVFSWCVLPGEPDGTRAIILPGADDLPDILAGSNREELGEIFEKEGIGLADVPVDARKRIAQHLLREGLALFEKRAAEINHEFLPLLEKLVASGADAPGLLRQNAEHALEEEFRTATKTILSADSESLSTLRGKADDVSSCAARMGLFLDKTRAAHLAGVGLLERVRSFPKNLSRENISLFAARLEALQRLDLLKTSSAALRREYWRFTRDLLPNMPEAGDPQIWHELRQVGDLLGFSTPG